MSKVKQKYSTEYKLGAVKLITEQNYSYAEAGRSLGILGNLISCWHKEIQALDNHAFPGQGQLTPDQERTRSGLHYCISCNLFNKHLPNNTIMQA